MLHRWIMGGLVTFVLALAVSAAGAQTPCHTAISCDCEAIEAGLLSGPWRQDCRSCQEALIDACLEAYQSQPIHIAATAGGYCENRCSVTGPNPYPAAPPSSPPAPEAGSVPRPATLTLACALNASWVVEEKDGLFWQGCRREDGAAMGIWVATDADGNVVGEIVFDGDGRVVHHTDLR